MVFVLGKLMRYGYLGLHIANSDLETTPLQAGYPRARVMHNSDPGMVVYQEDEFTLPRARELPSWRSSYPPSW